LNGVAFWRAITIGCGRHIHHVRAGAQGIRKPPIWLGLLRPRTGSWKTLLRPDSAVSAAIGSRIDKRFQSIAHGALPFVVQKVLQHLGARDPNRIDSGETHAMAGQVAVLQAHDRTILKLLRLTSKQSPAGWRARRSANDSVSLQR